MQNQGTLQIILQNKKPGGTYPPRGSRKERYEISRGPEQPPSYAVGSDYEFCGDSIHFVFNKGPKTPGSSNIVFDEISNTQVLGDGKLANRAGKQLTQRFKLDSGACANLLPIGIYSKLFSKKDRDLKGSIDTRVSLITANNNTRKQYHKDVQVRFQPSYNRSITSPKTSLSYPATQLPSHTSPQNPQESSRPTNSNHRVPPSPSQSSAKSSLVSSTKISSSSSSQPKPKSWSSLKRLSDGQPQHHNAGSCGKKSPLQAKLQCISSQKKATSGVVLPQKT